MPISQTWSQEHGVQVLTVIYEQRGPDMSQAYANCPNCGTALTGRNIWQCIRCGYRFGLIAGTSAQAHVAAQGGSFGGGVAGAIVLVLVLVFGSLWILNHTRLGLEIECRYLSEATACFRIGTSSVTDVPGWAMPTTTATRASISGEHPPIAIALPGAAGASAAR